MKKNVPYDFNNLCEMFENSVEAVLGALDAGNTEKAKHRCQEILFNLQRLRKKYGKQAKITESD